MPSAVNKVKIVGGVGGRHLQVHHAVQASVIVALEAAER